MQGTIDEARDSYAIWIETVPTPFSCVLLEFAVYHSLTMHLRTHISEYSFRHMNWWSKRTLQKKKVGLLKCQLFVRSYCSIFFMV